MFYVLGFTKFNKFRTEVWQAVRANNAWISKVQKKSVQCLYNLDKSSFFMNKTKRIQSIGRRQLATFTQLCQIDLILGYSLERWLLKVQFPLLECLLLKKNS